MAIRLAGLFVWTWLLASKMRLVIAYDSNQSSYQSGDSEFWLEDCKSY